MATLDLSLVTETMLRLLRLQLPEYGVLPGGAGLNVSAAAPDAVTGNFGLSFYLYHVREDAHTKAQEWGADADVPQSFRSMGLTLYYVLSARSAVPDVAVRATTEQQLMGLAIKALHDHPVLDDSSAIDTGIGPQPVFPNGFTGAGNRLRISMQPVPYDEASHYWQAGSQPLRLSAYYEVAATLLTPEQPRTRATRVLTVGVHSFARGTPRIDRTRSVVPYAVPGEATPRQVEFSPAEVSHGARLDVIGADLKGDRSTLLLRHRDFAAPLEIDPLAWQLATDGSVLSVVVQPAIGAQPLLPGIYGAVVSTLARRRLPDGSSRDFEWRSNESGFALVPRIDAITVPPGGLMRMTVADFDATLLDPAADIEFFLGTTRLEPVPGAPAPGEFQVQDPTHLRFRAPAGTPAGARLPVRVIVRGAENAPRWVVAP